MKLARALLIALAVVLIGAAQSPEASAAGYSAETEQAQRLLQSLGYDPGPVDGLAGGRVRAAVRAFQRDRELPQTGVIDGRLLGALERAAQPPDRGVARAPLPAPAAIVAPPPPPPAPPLQGQTWRIVDDNLAETVLTFAAGGKVVGPAFADGMRWSQPDPTRLRLVFETPLGGRAVRTGRLLSDDTMQGEGESNRRAGRDPAPRRWSWRAERISEG